MSAKQKNIASAEAMDASKVRALRMTGWFLLAAPSFYLVLLFAAFPGHVVRGIGPGFLLVLAIVTLLLLRTGRALTAARLLVYAGWTGLAVAAAFGGGVYAPQIVALPLAIVLAGWMLGPRHAIAVAALSILLGLGLAVATHLGRLALPPPAPPLLMWISFALPAAIVCLLTLYIVRSYEGRLEAQRRTEEELRRSEDKFGKVFRSNPLAVSITRLEDGRYVDVNDTWLQLFGWSREEVVGRTSLELGKWVQPADRESWAGALRRSGRIQNMETRFHTKNGGVLDVLLSAEMIDLAGEQCALIMVSDNTDRKRAEQALRESETLLRIAVQGGNIGLWEWDVATDKLRWNKRLRAIFGLPPDEGELTLPRFLAAIHPDDVEATQDAFMTALANDTEFDKEYRIVWPDGTVRWIVARGHGEYAADGTPLRMTGAALDITERLQAEASQRESQERFAKIFEASPVTILITRKDTGQYLNVNESFTRQFGWARQEVIGRTSLDIGIWQSARERERWVDELGRRGTVRDYEVGLLTRSGELRQTVVAAEAIEIGGMPCIISMIHDITDRKQAEEALRASQARLTEAQRIGHFGSWDLDLATGRMEWTDELFRIFDCGRDAFGGTWNALLDMVHPDDMPVIRNAFRESAATQGAYEIDHRIVTPAGQVKFLHVRWEVSFDEGGKPVRALGTAQDITEQRLAKAEIERLNAELEQRVQERTAELTAANRELESFAYSISHDLRAPLRGIDGFSKLLADEYRERLDDEGVDYLDRVRRAAQRMGTLIDDILELSRVTRQEMRRVRVDLSQIAAEIIEERSRAEPDHRVAVTLAPDCTAHGDPQLLRVLMQNLLENAWKYSAKKADPAIEFGRETIDGETVFFVRDNGVGFDMKYADRLFTPFQRLHRPEEFEGTGIGLATVARIIRRHGGRVWAESGPDEGTTLRFVLGAGGRP
ncbi:MAG: PAS domain S-box protein [Denitratisoma sp.]|nr:PAS domain S-box protein [Denitratisoma sp.]